MKGMVGTAAFVNDSDFELLILLQAHMLCF